MIRKKQVIFVPGYGDYSTGKWPVWLGQELVKAGFEFHNLTMPNPLYPNIKEWLNFLKEQKFKITKDTYFVGHSLGCITIARYLEKLPARSKVGGCVFVAGFCSILKLPFLSEFCNLPLDFDKVKKRAEEFVVIASDNDHIIPPADSLEFAGRLGARTITEHVKGHFRDDISELRSALNTILEWDQMKEERKEMYTLKKHLV